MQNDRKVLYMENTFGYTDIGSPGTFSIPSSPFMRSRAGTPAVDSSFWHGPPMFSPRQTCETLGDVDGTLYRSEAPSNWGQSPAPTREARLLAYTPFEPTTINGTPSLDRPLSSRATATCEDGSNEDSGSHWAQDSEEHFSEEEQVVKPHESHISAKTRSSSQDISTNGQGQHEEPMAVAHIEDSGSSQVDGDIVRSALGTQSDAEDAIPARSFDNSLIGGRYRVVVVQSLKDGRFYDPKELDDGALILGTDEKSITTGASASAGLLLAAMAGSGSRASQQSTKRQTTQTRKRAPPPYRLASDMPPPPVPPERDGQGERTAQYKGASTRISIQAMVKRAREEGIQFVASEQNGGSGTKKRPRRR